METGNTQVGGGTRAEAGDTGMEMGYSKVIRGPHTGADMMEGLGAPGWDDGGGSGYPGKGGVYRSG